jgi:S-adenosylmethionine synthetase
VSTGRRSVFNADTVFTHNYLTKKSPDIAQGVDAKAPRQDTMNRARAIRESS